MSYRVEVIRRARKQLSRLHPESRERIMEAIDALADTPRPRDSRKLQGREGYRIRVGSYRALYRVDEEQREVTVFLIAHRREVYR